jgi:hypothetical protein
LYGALKSSLWIQGVGSGKPRAEGDFQAANGSEKRGEMLEETIGSGRIQNSQNNQWLERHPPSGECVRDLARNIGEQSCNSTRSLSGLAIWPLTVAVPTPA